MTNHQPCGLEKYSTKMPNMGYSITSLQPFHKVPNTLHIFSSKCQKRHRSQWQIKWLTMLKPGPPNC